MTNHAHTDESLAQLALQDPTHLGVLIERYQDKLMRYIFRLSNVSKEEAEDILQEVFIKVYQNLNAFDPSLKFSSWIYRITYNQVISNHRKRKARPQQVHLEQDIFHNIASEFDLTKELDQKYTKEQIEKILSKMDTKYKDILILKFLEEKSYKEISDILKKPMGTIATLVNRAKKQFKKQLEQQL